VDTQSAALINHPSAPVAETMSEAAYPAVETEQATIPEATTTSNSEAAVGPTLATAGSSMGTEPTAMAGPAEAAAEPAAVVGPAEPSLNEGVPRACAVRKSIRDTLKNVLSELFTNLEGLPTKALSNRRRQTVEDCIKVRTGRTYAAKRNSQDELHI